MIGPDQAVGGLRWLNIGLLDPGLGQLALP